MAYVLAKGYGRAEQFVDLPGITGTPADTVWTPWAGNAHLYYYYDEARRMADQLSRRHETYIAVYRTDAMVEISPDTHEPLLPME